MPTGTFAPPEEFRGEILLHEPLSRHTSLKVGGPADLFATPADESALVHLVRHAAEHRVPLLVVGGGYNLLVKDGGFRGVVLSLGKLVGCRETPEGVAVGAGTKNADLVKWAIERDLGGVEFLSGIPGTVGGALAMNAGAHGEAILDRVASITTLRSGEVVVTERGDLTWGYRFLSLAQGEIILGATLALHPTPAAKIARRMDACRVHRQGAQPVKYPNAGSFFKNPEGAAAWRLIDAVGLRGYRMGGAQVSEVHTNFLVNRGGATARDFLRLAGLIKEKVRAATGIMLEEEVRIVGEDTGTEMGTADGM